MIVIYDDRSYGTVGGVTDLAFDVGIHKFGDITRDSDGNDRVLIYLGPGGVPQATHFEAIDILGAAIAPAGRNEVGARTRQVA